uniref:FBA_2 domain-containing protein n=1 Tax=Steinernema glaseri TaxID=37863 RepID=A0A1I7Y7Z5_9BILA
MDDVPFLFVNAVFHCLNSESLSAPRLLAHPLWSSVAEEHHQKRKDYVFWLCYSDTDKYQFIMEQTEKYPHLTPEEWLRSDKTHLRVRKMNVSGLAWTYAPYRTFEETLQWSLRMAPYLNNLEKMVSTMSLGSEAQNFDFFWKRPCLTFDYYYRDINIFRWHIENNDRLKSIRSPLFSYDEVSDLIHLCAEKRLAWEMRFSLDSNRLKNVKTWKGDAKWAGIYPLVTNKIAYARPFQPDRGIAFYEDEHIRKELVWSKFVWEDSSFTITWK